MAGLSNFLFAPTVDKSSAIDADAVRSRAAGFGGGGGKFDTSGSFDLKKLFSDFGKGLNQTFESTAKSAMEAEKAAAREANAFTRSERLAAEDFSARQAELAYQRSQASAREANDFTKSERLAAQQFYERMSSTAYQRAMSDMRAAGLNPILAYTQGGASASSVSAGSGASVQASAASSSGHSGSKASMASGKSSDQQLALMSIQTVASVLNNLVSSAFGASSSLAGKAIAAALMG